MSESLPLSLASFIAWRRMIVGISNYLSGAIVSKLVEMATPDKGSAFADHLTNIVRHVLAGETERRDYEGKTYDFATNDAFMEAVQKLPEIWCGEIDVLVSERYLFSFSLHIPQPDEKVKSVLFAQFVRGADATNAKFDEDLFMAGLLQAARHGGKPLDMLRVLADQGFNTVDRRSPAWQNVVGQE